MQSPMNIILLFRQIGLAVIRYGWILPTLTIISLNSCDKSGFTYATQDEIDVINATILEVAERVDYPLEVRIHPILMPASWYGGSFRTEELVKLVQGKLDNMDEVLNKMDSKDSIYIKSDQQLYKNEFMTTKLEMLPKVKFKRVGTRGLVNFHYSSIGFNADHSTAFVIFNYLYSSMNAGTNYYILRRRPDGKYNVKEKIFVHSS